MSPKLEAQRIQSCITERELTHKKPIIPIRKKVPPMRISEKYWYFFSNTLLT